MLIGGLIYIGTPALKPTSRSCTMPRSSPSCCSASRFFIALGFEFVNGFHDTANAVATVIYTHSLEPHIAVVWSGILELYRRPHQLERRGRLFAIISLLPVELILKVSAGSGFSMVFALLDRRDSSGTSPPGGAVCRLRARTP